jgi:hypothetical protein
VTLGTLENPSLIAFSIALGGRPGQTFPFPDGAIVVAPASLFRTVHPSGSTLVAELVHAGTDAPVAGPAPTVHVDLKRRQTPGRGAPRGLESRRPHRGMAMGVGLWDSTSRKYLLPHRRGDRPGLVARSAAGRRAGRG